MNKIAIVGVTGMAGLHESMAQMIKDEQIDLISPEEAKDRYLEIPYHKAPELPLFESKTKPTCERHHEYVEHKTREGNHIHSTWKCRFCDKTL